MTDRLTGTRLFGWGGGIAWLLFTACATVFAVSAGCQQPTDNGSSDATDDNGNQSASLVGEPPEAQASSSAYAFVFPGDQIQLSGTGSDPDQAEADPDPVLRWFQVSGTEVELAGVDTPEASFTVPAGVVPGETLGFELRVTDADGNTTSDWVYLFIPRGDAVLLASASGPDDAVPAGVEATLASTGSLNIPDDTAVYRWEQLEGGPTVDLDGADTPTATFVAPDPGDSDVTLTFRLTLENGQMTAEALVEVIITSAEDGDQEPDEEPQDGDAAAGEAVFTASGCGACHGDDAGGEPNLQGPGRLPALEERFASGGNHFGKTLTDADVVDVAAWLATLGDDGMDGDAQDGPCALEGADSDEGEAAYAANTCSACHQADASGGIGPNLRGGDRTPDLEERFLPEGTTHNGATLTDDEIRDLACWFSSLEP